MPARLRAPRLLALRAFVVVALALLAIDPAATPPASAAPAADVVQAVAEVSMGTPLAQSFVPQTTGQLTSIDLRYSSTRNAADGWTITVREGSPSGPVLGTGTVAGDDTAAIATFDSPIGVIAGRTYVFELRAVDFGRQVFFAIATSSAYAGGALTYGPTLNFTSSTYDATFTTYVDAAAATAPTLSGTAPLAVRGKAYDGYAFAVGGFPAPKVTVVGSLPPGMSLSSSGVLTGTPTASGSYPVTIVASNGTGTDASLSATLSVREPIKPAVPVIYTATVVSVPDGATWRGTVTVLKPAADGDHPVTGVTITANNGASCTTPEPPAFTEVELSCTIAGLPFGVPVTVVATSTSLAGTTSTASAGIGTYYTNPSAVRDLTATPGPGEVTLSWQAPEVIGSASLRGYEVRYRAVGATAWSTVSVTDPTATVNATNGVPFEFGVRAVGILGHRGPWTDPSVGATARTVPDAPNAPALVAADGRIAASWTPPVWDGGNDISAYEVSYRAAGDAAWTGPQSVGDTVAEISPLTNGTSYDVRVRAVNDAGTSGWSSVASTTPRTVPDAPGAPTLTPSDASLDVAWAAPTGDGGATVTGYELEYRAVGAADWSAVIPLETESARLDGLANGTQVEVRVRAVNEAGAGEWSDASSATPRTVPTALTALIASAGNEAIDAAWGAPDSDGGAAVERYEYSLRSSLDIDWGTPDAATSPLALTGLTNGETYQLRVRAVNAAGPGPWEYSGPLSPRTVPGQPGALALVPGDGTIDATWAAPSSDGGSPVEGYEYSYRPAGGASWSAPAAVADLAAATTGLTNGTAYEVRVRALNAAGASGWSGAVATTPFVFAVDVHTLTGEPLDGAELVPGQEFAVTASDLPVGSELVVTFHSDPVELARVTVGTDGAVALRLAVPANATGDHTVIATLRGTGAPDATVSAAVRVRQPGVLVFTGADVAGQAGAAGALLVLGAVLLVVRRRVLAR